MTQYYPLAAGNSWEYKMKDGNTYTNSVTSIDGQVVTMKSTAAPDPTRVKVDNGSIYNELMSPGNYQLWLKDNIQKGEQWEAAFSANGLNSIMAFTVKETGISKEVEGKTYNDVVMLEAESKINMNGNLINTNFFTQYYYAKGVGLILTTSSMGDVHALKNGEQRMAHFCQQPTRLTLAGLKDAARSCSTSNTPTDSTPETTPQ